MTKEQILAVRCAYADLQGVEQAFDSCDPWEINKSAIVESLVDLEDAFPFLSQAND